MTGHNYDVVDKVTRETAKHLEDTDATLAWDEDGVFVLEPRDSGPGE